MSFLAYQKENPEFLNDYLKYRRYILFFSETSVNEAYFDLRTFFRYIKLFFYNNTSIDNITIEELRKVSIKDVQLKDLNNVTEDIIYDYIFFLDNNLSNSAKTRNRKLNSLRNLFRYLEQNKLISTNAALYVRSASVEKRLPKFLDLEECKRMLSEIIKSNQRYKLRNYAIACLFLNCSIRLSELVNIDLSDIKLDAQELIVHGKGGIDRLIYLNEATVEAIDVYIKKARIELSSDNYDHNALFISERYKRISRRTVQHIIEQELELTLKEKKTGFHTHSLRHTGATLLYNKTNVNIFVLQRLLGHKNLNSTQIYTHVSNKELKRVMENCSLSSILEREAINNV